MVHQPRGKKRLVIAGLDLLCLLLAMAGSFYARFKVGTHFTPLNTHTVLFFLILPFLSVASFYFLGLYRLVTRHIGAKGLWRIGYSLLIAIIYWTLLIIFSGYHKTLSVEPFSILIGYWLLGWLIIWTNRQVIHWWLRHLPLNLSQTDFSPEKIVMIYGAGEAGLQVLHMLNESGHYRVIGFFDDDHSLWGMKMNGYKIYNIEQFEKLITKHGIKEVFIAIPSLKRSHKKIIIRKLEPHPVKVRILPQLDDITSGQIEISDLRNIEVNDLLGRDPVPPNPELLKCNIAGKSVMITGAGGSIGSEIVRQIFELNPARIVLLELSEFALYSIEKELEEKLEKQHDQAMIDHLDFNWPVFISVLGSVDDKELVRKTILSHNVKTVYHAAAYKHIPILENNLNAALKNNTFATKILAEIVQECGVERMVLISSDKAVRPANMKGASNRLAEMILQAMANQSSSGTVFTAVRFGNVLDSSGSVVPRFREQIQKGGPVTVTHVDIIRYFMSIPEAAQLVIQAGAMAQKDELYVLDMGTPVKINELARTMIRLSGKEVRDQHNPDGDIELKYIGLRSGDKMHEELLIDGDIIRTQHPRIMCIDEAISHSLSEITTILDQLDKAMQNNDDVEIQDILSKTVEGYHPYITKLEPVPEHK